MEAYGKTLERSYDSLLGGLTGTALSPQMRTTLQPFDDTALSLHRSHRPLLHLGTEPASPILLPRQISLGPTISEETKRFRIQSSIGTPFLLNLGFRYTFAERYFGELELPLILRFLIRNGYFGVSGGIRWPAPSHSGSKSSFSAEGLITLGNTQVFFGPSGFYVGGAVAGNMETQIGIVLFLRIGGAYFPNGFGSGLLAFGIGWTF